MSFIIILLQRNITLMKLFSQTGLHIWVIFSYNKHGGIYTVFFLNKCYSSISSISALCTIYFSSHNLFLTAFRYFLLTHLLCIFFCLTQKTSVWTWLRKQNFPKKVKSPFFKFFNYAKNVPEVLPSSPIKKFEANRSMGLWVCSDMQTNRDFIIYADYVTLLFTNSVFWSFKLFIILI